MDIHKPKAAHSWREFLIEIGTIICGILIALSLEQAVELARRQEAVANAREALREEVGLNYRYFAWRLAQSDCIDRHISQTSALLEKVARTGSTPNVEGVGLALSRRIVVGAWESERAAQTIVHFPPWERTLYSTAYQQIEGFAQWRNSERESWRALSLLDGPPKRIGQTMIDELRLKLIEAQSQQRAWRDNVPAYRDWAKRLGVKLEPPPGASPNICKDIRTW